MWAVGAVDWRRIELGEDMELDVNLPVTLLSSFRKSHLHTSDFVRHPRSAWETSNLSDLNTSTPTTTVTTDPVPSPNPSSRFPSITSNAHENHGKINPALNLVDGQANTCRPIPRATAAGTAVVRQLAQQHRPSQQHKDETPLLDAKMRIAAACARLDAEAMALEAVRTSTMEATLKDTVADVQEAKDALAQARAAVLMGADRLVVEAEAARERAWRDASYAAAARAAVDDAALAGARATAAKLAKSRLDTLKEAVEEAERREVAERTVRSRMEAVALAEAKAQQKVLEEGYVKTVAAADTAATVRTGQMEKLRLAMENELRGALAAFQDANAGRQATAASHASTAEATLRTAVAAARSLREAQTQVTAAARGVADVQMRAEESSRNRARATTRMLAAAGARAAAVTLEEAAEAARYLKAVHLEAVKEVSKRAEEGLGKAKCVQSLVRASALAQKEEHSREGERKWVEASTAARNQEATRIAALTALRQAAEARVEAALAARGVVEAAGRVAAAERELAADISSDKAMAAARSCTAARAQAAAEWRQGIEAELMDAAAARDHTRDWAQQQATAACVDAERKLESAVEAARVVREARDITLQALCATSTAAVEDAHAAHVRARDAVGGRAPTGAVAAAVALEEAEELAYEMTLARHLVVAEVEAEAAKHDAKTRTERARALSSMRMAVAERQRAVQEEYLAAVAAAWQAATARQAAAASREAAAMRSRALAEVSAVAYREAAAAASVAAARHDPGAASVTVATVKTVSVSMSAASEVGGLAARTSTEGGAIGADEVDRSGNPKADAAVQAARPTIPAPAVATLVTGEDVTEDVE
ncbi:hypothetical protein Vafri_12624 [Volvox africanus]|uniref:Uncharacterized protein n=1 Tax=Volvox africanus TaxID=51714 RepID=A0A8J4B9U3_9CHLO|nr:hypothetical protein Vafri_12624 [Volvox africanus]